MLPKCDWDAACRFCVAQFVMCKHECGVELRSNNAWYCIDCGKPESMMYPEELE